MNDTTFNIFVCNDGTHPVTYHVRLIAIAKRELIIPGIKTVRGMLRAANRDDSLRLSKDIYDDLRYGSIPVTVFKTTDVTEVFDALLTLSTLNKLHPDQYLTVEVAQSKE
jgi:hypothetical protein